MHTIGMSCRRGTSTTFGVMIFIGIMFTAVIPMFLVMNQADTLHEIRKVEVSRLDEERARENIYFYLEPSVEVDEPILTLKIINRGELAVRIARVWINDEFRDNFTCIIPPISDTALPFGNLTVLDPPELTSYHVIATTDRGNFLSPLSGMPTLNSSTNVWTMDCFKINVEMEMPTNSLHISVVKDAVTFFDEDVPSWRNRYPISVPEEGTYNATVYRFYDQNPQYILWTQNVTLSLLYPSYEVWVPAE